MEENNPPKKSATDEEIQELVAERLLINAIKRRQQVCAESSKDEDSNIDLLPGAELRRGEANIDQHTLWVDTISCSGRET